MIFMLMIQILIVKHPASKALCPHRQKRHCSMMAVRFGYVLLLRVFPHQILPTLQVLQMKTKLSKTRVLNISRESQKGGTTFDAICAESKKQQLKHLENQREFQPCVL